MWSPFGVDGGNAAWQRALRRAATIHAMRREDIRSLLRAVPFVPIRVGLSDGRCILIRHPDQAIVTERLLMVGLAQVGMSAPLATPDSGDVFARGGFWADLLHIVSVEPVAEAA